MKSIATVILVLIITTACQISPIINETPYVFFCGGQSNATVQWSLGIEDRLLRTFENVIVIQQRYPGNAIDQWHDGVNVGPNLIDDMNLILSYLPDNYVFGGLFWFQGEADRLPENASLYPERFKAMTDYYAETFGAFPVQIAIVDCETPGLYDDIRAAQSAMAIEDPNIHFTDTRGYDRRDGVHLTASEYWRLGQNMADMFVSFFGREI